MSIRTQPLQEAFNAGELGARMHARVQFDKYRNAGAIYENILPLPQGGFSRRPGARYVNGLINNSVASVLARFVFSQTDAYVMELGANLIRWYANQAVVATPDLSVTPTLANGTFDADIASWTSISAGTGAISWDATNARLSLDGNGSGNAGVAEQAIANTSGIGNGTMVYVSFDVYGQPDDVIEVGHYSLGVPAFTRFLKPGHHIVGISRSGPGDSVIYFSSYLNTRAVTIDNVIVVHNSALQMTSPWAEADNSELAYVQTNDLMYWALGGTTRPRRLTRYSDYDWSMEEFLGDDGPYLAANLTATTLTPGATSGLDTTITASATTGINDDRGFEATDVGRCLRIKDAANKWRWMRITAHTSSTVVRVNILSEALSSAAARTDWRMGEWGDATDRGWPKALGFVQQRLAAANTRSNTQKFWTSVSADLENFADEDVDGDQQADSSIVYALSSKNTNPVQWISTRRRPVFGTEKSEWVLRTSGEIYTPTDVAADIETTAGASRVAPVDAHNRMLFLQAGGRKLEEFSDAVRESGVVGFDAFDLTILNNEVLVGGARDMEYQQEPDSVVWLVRNDGQMPTLTYQPDQEVLGWSRQILGGDCAGGCAVVESVTSIPGGSAAGQFKDSTGTDEVWVTVKRTINGAEVRYIEVFETAYLRNEDLEAEAFYVDSGLTYSVPTTITAATAAEPVEVTSAVHGLVDNDRVRIERVLGMTELNSQSFRIYEATTNTVELAEELGAVINNITQANPGVVSAVAHGLTTGQDVALLDVSGMTNVNGVGYTATVIDDDSFSIGVNTTGFGAYTTGGSAHKGVDGVSYTAYGSDGQIRKKATVVSGLTHLEGETVSIFADGASQAQKVVAGGAITLDEAASIVHVGLPYQHIWKSLKLAYGAENGTAVGKVKNIGDVILTLLDAAEGSLEMYTTELYDGEWRDSDITPLDLRVAGNIDGDAVPLFSGEKRLGVASGQASDIRLVLQGSAPGPLTVTGVSPELETAS